MLIKKNGLYANNKLYPNYYANFFVCEILSLKYNMNFLSQIIYNFKSIKYGEMWA